MIPLKPLTIAFLAFVTTVLGNGCDGGYKQNGNFCYMLIDGTAAFAEADNYCKAEGGNVVSIHTKAENDFVASFGADVFIGLQYNAQGKNYSWSDGTPFDMQNWEQNYPKNPDFEGNCAQMLKSGKWINFECKWKTRYVCKKVLPQRCPVQPDNQFFVNGEVTSPGYPGNYVRGLSCTYELEVKNDLNVNIDVTEMVMGAGDTIEIFSRLVADNAYRIAELSGNLTNGPKTFTTPEGENRMLVKFTSKSQNGGYWKFDFGRGDCPKGWIFGGESGLNYCYTKPEDDLNFSNAKRFCEKEGGQVISVHNAFQNKFLQEKISENHRYLWLGLVYDNGSWKWTDGSNTQYTNWDSGHPQGTDGTCVRMMNTGRWQTVGCDGIYGFAVCYKP